VPSQGMPKARQSRPEARQCTVTNDTSKLQLSAKNSVKDAIHLSSRKKEFFQVQNLGNNLLDYVGNRSQKAHTKNVRYSTIQHSLFNGFIMEEDH